MSMYILIFTEKKKDHMATGSSSVSLTLLTWNINKGTFPSDVQQEGHAKRRNLVIPAVLDYIDEQGEKPHVWLFQESPVTKRSARSKWGLSSNYEQQRERRDTHQGIDTTLGLKDMGSLSDQINELVPNGETHDEDALAEADKRHQFTGNIIVRGSNDRKAMRSDIPKRAFARKLEVSQRGTNITVIVVSFHSVYKVTNEEKKRYIRLFFNLMCRLAQIHKCLVLVGADFNLKVKDWKRDIERVFEGQVHVAETYQPTPRRDCDNIIDTFAVVYPPGRKTVECTLSEPHAHYPFSGRDGDQFTKDDKESLMELLPKTSQGDPNWEILRYDLDHDPVIVNAKLTLQTS